MKPNRIYPLDIMAQVMVVLLCVLSAVQFHHHGCDDHHPTSYGCHCGHHDACPADMSPFAIVKSAKVADQHVAQLLADHHHPDAIAAHCEVCIRRERIRSVSFTLRRTPPLPDVNRLAVFRRGPPPVEK